MRACAPHLPARMESRSHWSRAETAHKSLIRVTKRIYWSMKYIGSCSILTLSMKSNNFAMKDWHLEHSEKVIIRFAKGLASDATAFERRNHKRYGSITQCVKQLEYDMKHGVEKGEVMDVIRKVRQQKKYSQLRADPGATQRLVDLEGMLSGTRKVEAELLWHNYAYKPKTH